MGGDNVAYLTIGLAFGAALVIGVVVIDTAAKLKQCEYTYGTPCHIQATVKPPFTLPE